MPDTLREQVEGLRDWTRVRWLRESARTGKAVIGQGADGYRAAHVAEEIMDRLTAILDAHPEQGTTETEEGD